MTTHVGAAWRRIRDRFAAAGFDNATLDARLLAQLAFGLDHAGLIAREREPAAPEPLVRLDALAVRRMAGEPLARILGHKDFFGLDFCLSDATLVPRPETELVVETVVGWRNVTSARRLLDLGTGSGAIAVAILSAAPHLRAVGVDLDARALETARENAGRHGVAERFEARQGGWFGAVAQNETFEIVVSNPPYIESHEISGLDSQVRRFDPRLALDGGMDGLDAYRAIVAEAGAHVTPGGLLVLEIGSTQAKAVSDMVDAAGFEAVEVLKDLAGLDRVVRAVLKP